MEKTSVVSWSCCNKLTLECRHLGYDQGKGKTMVNLTSSVNPLRARGFFSKILDFDK